MLHQWRRTVENGTVPDCCGMTVVRASGVDMSGSLGIRVRFGALIAMKCRFLARIV